MSSTEKNKQLTVAELREALEGMPDDLTVAISSSDFFPFSRDVTRVAAVATRTPHNEGRLVLFGGTPKAIIQQKPE